MPRTQQGPRMSADAKRRVAAERRLFKKQINRTIRALPDPPPDPDTLVAVELALRPSTAWPVSIAPLWRLFRSAGDGPQQSQNLDSSEPRDTRLETPEF